MKEISYLINVRNFLFDKHNKLEKLFYLEEDKYNGDERSKRINYLLKLAEMIDNIEYEIEYLLKIRDPIKFQYL